METRLVKINNMEDCKKDMEEAGELIKAGELVAFPTETVYGLGGNGLLPDAAKKIYAAKGRPSDNPLILHVCDMQMVESLVKEIPDNARRAMEHFWPGPMTVILQKADQVPDCVTGGLDTVAIRMPDHPVALELIRRSGVPIAAPSANTSGRPSPTKAEHVMEDLHGKIPMILDGGAVMVGVESTIIDFTEIVPVILRPGWITKESMEGFLGCEVLMNTSLKASDHGIPRAPGMKYKHYAPKAQVYLVRGNNFVDFVNRDIDESTAVVCFDEDEKYINGETFPIGSKTDYKSHAHKIFDVLRKIDKEEKIKKVFAPLPRTDGVSLAVYNRLIRSSAFRIFNADAYVLGLTGPTGSGKSTIAKMFAQYGFHTVDTDKIARNIMEKGSPVLAKIKETFGDDVVKDNVLDRKLLAKRAFVDENSTKKLNQITHPYIYEKALLEIEEYSHKGYDKFILDAPVLFESNGERFCNNTLVILSNLDTRVKRIISRDAITTEQAMDRINAQHSDDFYRAKADYVIENNGSLDEVKSQVESVVKAIL